VKDGKKGEDLVSELQSQISTMEQRRQAWEPLWTEVVDFCFPSRSFDPVKDQTKDKRPKVNFNNRAALDVAISSAGFQGYTANRRQVWAKLQFEDLDLNKQYGVADWLELCERKLYSVFSRNGLYEALGELVPDGITIGTGAMYIEEIGPGKIAYQARHPLSIWIAENASGEIDTVLEDVPMSHRAIIERFGEERVPQRIRDLAKTNPYQIMPIRHMVMPMDKRYLAHAQQPVESRMGYCSIWYDKAESTILDVGGYWEFPFPVWRYGKNAGEEYGRSAGQNALGDIMAGNQMTRSRIKLGNLIADPTLLVDDGLEGQDTIIPGHHIYRESREDTIEPVQVGANYPITKDNEDRQDALIDAHFNIPIYLMLQQMERQMTAREVIERTGEKASILGPTTGRYEREVLLPVIRRTFNILMRSNQLPPPPPAILEAQGKAQLKIEFLGFLAQLQQRYYQTNGINATMAFVAGMGQMFPESTDWVHADNLMVEGMESSGSPQSGIREEADVMKIREERLRAQAARIEQEQNAQQEQGIMQNADKLGKKPEQGSPMDNMAQAMAGGM